jgi:predicted protein tyrosine phosphatase
MMNRLHNCKNPYQGKYKKVLSVCSAGLLRSPTIAWLLSQDPYNYNTRACGIHDYALVPLDQVLLTWADEIVCVQLDHEVVVRKLLEDYGLKTPVFNLMIPDNFEYRNPELIEMIRRVYPFQPVAAD